MPFKYWNGEKLAALRRMKGISQDALGLGIDVSREAIRRYENGTNVPNVDRALGLADCLGVDISELIERR